MNRITRLALVGVAAVAALVVGSTPALAMTPPDNPTGGAGQPALTQVEAGSGVPVWITIALALALVAAVLVAGFWAATRAGRDALAGAGSRDGVASAATSAT
jgi:hypothetical protein